MNEPRILAVGEELPPMNPAPIGSTPPEPNAAKGSTKGIVGQRFKMLNTFVDTTMAELSRAEIAVWFALFRDARDGSARTSMADIARRVGCSRRAVVSAIARLNKRGLLRTLYKGGLNRGSSRYSVLPLAKDT